MNLVPIQMLVRHCPAGREAELIAQYLTALELPEPVELPEVDVINDDTLESVKTAHIKRILATSKTKAEAIRRLDISHNTLYQTIHRMQQNQQMQPASPIRTATPT